MRLVLEEKQHASSYFCTFSVDDAHRNEGHSLSVEVWQKLMKRLRHHRPGDGIRYFCAGEYGSRTLREHYHALLFGLVLDDLVPIAGKVGEFTSEFLNEVWGMGFVHVGAVTADSIAYCTEYIVDKRTGPLAESHYSWVDPVSGEVHRRTPEFALMSRRPGIGAAGFQRWSAEIFRGDFIAIKGGGKAPVPAYYDRLLLREDPEFLESIKVARMERAATPQNAWNSTPERLAVREEVARSRRQAFRKGVL